MTLSLMVSEYREGLARGELLVQQCKSCGKLNMYPRYACPFCQSESLSWHRVSGRGVLHSFTILRMGAPEGFESDLPYALAVVKLEEGVQLLARLVPDEKGEWVNYQCDSSVRLVTAPASQTTYRACAWFSLAPV